MQNEDNSFVKAGSNLSVRKRTMNPSSRDYLQKSLTLPCAHVIHKILSTLDVLDS